MFEEEKRVLNAIGYTAKNYAAALEDVQNVAYQAALSEAYSILLRNLDEAIRRTPEFWNPELYDRLIEFFGDESRIVIRKSGRLHIVTLPIEATKNAWRMAQYMAYSIERTPANQRERLAYWRKIFEGATNTSYEGVLKNRFAFLGSNPENLDYAAFWYFLEYGTPTTAYPVAGATHFLSRSRAQIENENFVTLYLSRAMNAFLREVEKGMMTADASGNIQRPQRSWGRPDALGISRAYYKTPKGARFTGEYRKVEYAPE